MFTKSKKFVRRGMALAAALGMAALGLVAVGAPGASAEPAIDPDSTYKVHVQLLSGNKIQDPDGKQLADVPADRILKTGKFKIEKGNYNITTTAGYNDAVKVVKGTGTFAPAVPADAKELAVDSTNGSITFEGLKPGLYRLTQTEAAPGYAPAKPALIMLPMTDPQTGSFMTDVYVYPKNAKLDKITKEKVTDKSVVLKPGSSVQFKITAPIASLESGDKFKSFKVFDLPSGALKVDIASGANIDKVEIIDPANPDAAALETLVKDTDYKVVEEIPTGKTAKAYGISLTADGLAKLDTNQGKAVRVTLTGKVADPMPTDVNQWFIKNGAMSVHTSEQNETPTTNETDPDTDPTQKMAKVKIINKNSKGDELTGAKFSVYSCAKEEAGKPISTTGAALYENVDAKAEIGPMAAGTDLCIKQTHAPTDYELGTVIVKAPFTEDAVAQAPKNAAGEPVVSVDYLNDLETSSLLAKLPLTGGAGIALFLIVAAGLLGGAYYYARRNRVRA